MNLSGRLLVLAAALASFTACGQKMVPLDVKLPGAAFKGTPQNIQTNTYTEPYSEAPPPALMVPEGLSNLATGAKLSSSSTNVAADRLALVIDGDKEAAEPSVVLL